MNITPKSQTQAYYKYLVLETIKETMQDFPDLSGEGLAKLLTDKVFAVTMDRIILAAVKKQFKAEMKQLFPNGEHHHAN